MSKCIVSKLKLCRREKLDLNIKSGIRNIESKCKFNQLPGQIHIRRSKISDYSLQLREKQKLKRMYCISEKQFYNYYYNSSISKKNTIELLFQKLETRLDNIVYRIGFGSTRMESRQLINHKLIKVNNKCVNIPSYSVKKGDFISISEKMFNNVKINFSIKTLVNRDQVNWVKLYKKELYGVLLYIPNKEEFLKNINANLIIELYSK